MFEFWEHCDAAEREALLAQLREIDPHAVNTVRRSMFQRPSATWLPRTLASRLRA